MEFRWQSAVGAVANVYGALGLTGAVIGTILGWAKLTRTLTAEWPFPIQVAFYVALFVLLFIIFARVFRELRALWRYLTRNTLGVVKASAAQDERAERVNDEQWSVIEALVRDDLTNMRSQVENAEHYRRQTRADNEMLSNRFQQAEAETTRLAGEKSAAVEAARVAEEEAATAKSNFRALTYVREAEQPLYKWASGLIENARGRIAEQIEIVDYQFHLHDLNEKVNAGFVVSVELRYWGVLIAQIGEIPEYGGRLFFQGRRMGRDPEIGSLRLGRGQTGWIMIRQTLEGDAAAVREDWEAGSIVVDASHLQLSIHCDDPAGGEPIVGKLRLKEMTWPKPSK